MTTPNPHDDTDQLRTDLRAALQRITTLEAEMAQLRMQLQRSPKPPLNTRTGDDRSPVPAIDSATGVPTDRETAASMLDRRRLLTRGGTAAVGAVLGGAAGTIATATPAAAAGTDGVFTSLEVDGPSTLNGTASIVGDGSTIFALEVGTPDAPPQRGVLARGAMLGLVGVGFAGVDGEGTSLGLVGNGGVYGLMVDGGQASVVLRDPSLPSPAHPVPTSTEIAHSSGELYLADSTDLWFCVGDGTPGTWRRVAGVSTAGALTMLASPVRVYDSRTGYPPSIGPKTPLTPGVDRVIDCTANTSGIPTDATAAIVTITIANPTGPGWLAARANQAPYTGTSTLNWTAPGAVVATTTTTALGPAATIALRTMTTTDAIVDVIGYHR